MTTLDFSAELNVPRGPLAPDQAELAAVAFLALYSGRTLDAYRHDPRNLFQWAADHGLAVLEATRAHLELYRASMEERGPAASTIDRHSPTEWRSIEPVARKGAEQARHRRLTHRSTAAPRAGPSSNDDNAELLLKVCRQGIRALLHNCRPFWGARNGTSLFRQRYPRTFTKRRAITPPNAG